MGELRPHLTQRRLGQDLPPYQVVSWSIQPFGHNGHVCSHCVCRCVKNGSFSSSSMEWKSTDSMVRISYYLGEWKMLLICSWWQFCLSARQCTSASCVQHSPTAAVQNSQLPFSWAIGRVTVQSLTPLTTRFRELCSSMAYFCFTAIIQENLHRNQVRNGGLCWRKVLLPACPYSWAFRYLHRLVFVPLINELAYSINKSVLRRYNSTLFNFYLRSTYHIACIV